jgi:AbrB family looped-hinge helix DNA binding protein
LELVTVKTKFQIVIPRSIREAAGVDIGDLLEAKVEGGKITFAPKSVVDRHLAEGLADLKAGRSHGPYSSAKEAISALESRTATAKTKRR